MTTRILLVDDHEIVLDGMRSVLNADSDLEVVGQAKDGREATAAAAALDPDVLVMDISMPGMNGIDAIRSILSEKHVAILCLSMHSERSFVEAAVAAGASGYLLKDSAMEELTRAIKSVARGEVYLSPAIAGSVVRIHRENGCAQPTRTAITAREREVLKLLAEGKATKEIAAILGVSPKTVGTHRERLMAKLRINSVAGLTKYAIRKGITTLEP